MPNPNRIHAALLLLVLLFKASGIYSDDQNQSAMFRGNPQHTGTFETEAVHQFKTVKWKFDTDGASREKSLSWRYTASAIQGSGSVADGVVYLGDMDGFLYALNASTGKEKWRFRTRDTILSSPVVADGTVYFGSDDGYLYALTGVTEDEPQHTAARKAVFWQEPLGDPYFFKGSEQTRDFFKAEGHEALNAAALAQFMREQIESRDPSVVVFAADRVPETVIADTSENALIRQYLEAGGKIVWLGEFPLGVLRDPDTGAFRSLDLSIPGRILGVDHSTSEYAYYMTTATEEGKKWGMPDWFLSGLAVDVDEVSSVLALDEYGRASAWVKNYGGPEGSGFVRLWGRDRAIEDLATVKLDFGHLCGFRIAPF